MKSLFLFSFQINNILNKRIMKKVFSVAMILLSFVSVHAQFKEIAVSPGFDEPNSGQIKLLLMKELILSLL